MWAACGADLFLSVWRASSRARLHLVCVLPLVSLALGLLSLSGGHECSNHQEVMSTAAEVYMCISGEGEGDAEDDGDDKYDYDYGGMELVMDDEKAKVL